MRFFIIGIASFFGSVLFADEKPQFAGPTVNGFLLPNGWTLTPAGRHVVLPDLPLNIISLSDNSRALVATSGFNRHEIALVDLNAAKIVTRETVKQSWFGLVHDTERNRIWWSGGGGSIEHHKFALNGNQFRRESEPDSSPVVAKMTVKSGHFTSGLALSRDGKTLFTLNVGLGLIHSTPMLDEAKHGEPVKIGGKPYDVLHAKNGKVYVSDWAGKQVMVLDPQSLKLIVRIPVGEHPNQLAEHPKDGRLFVACASTNEVAVIDTTTDAVIEKIFTALFPRAPEGSTPDALVVAPDGQTLYVANADNNSVTVIDIGTPIRSQVKGFIPTGWYPTALAMTPDGKNLLIGVGKGLQSWANPIGGKTPLPDDEPKRSLPYPYIGTTMSGALSIVPVPDEKKLAEYTAQVYRNCPYSDKLLTAAPYSRKTAIPTKVGDPSPIKHVLYIIKENRTYDQVFGDIKKGNGDPSLVMFGEKITPNHHKLAEEFVLLDNLYCNGQVSRDGHPWSTMAYANDYISRDWHLTYSGRTGIEDDDEARLASTPSGFIWDSAAKAGLSYRNYGEYGKRVSLPDGTAKMEARAPGLVGHISPTYGTPRKKGDIVRDSDRVEQFLEEFRQYEKKGDLPRLIVMSLPEDHTTGTKIDTYTPQACVASNDLALGRLIDAVSHSRYWPEMAIFVIEDDAQNGPDHVNAQRTVGLVVSPYTKRNIVDSTQYSTVSMIRTIELILGLPPLSQYDAAARPMFESFNDVADLRSYNHVPARIDLNTKNSRFAYGAERSGKMDFSEVDLIDDFELNEILWRAVKGIDTPIPPAARRAIAFRSQTATPK